MSTTETTIDTDAVANLDDLADGAMRMVKVDGHRVCLIRTAGGVHALDHACPHEGYGLTQGELNGDLLTCAWHNWKFRVTDGTCVQGEEGVTAHRVDVDDDGDIRVYDHPPRSRGRARRARSSACAAASRRTTRARSPATWCGCCRPAPIPVELIWEAVAHGAPRAEFGWGHSIASATDCLTMVDLYEGDQRALPIVQGIVGIAESERDRPLNPLPVPARVTKPRSRDSASAVETERTADAQALVLAAIDAATPRTICGRGSPPWSATICCRTATARSTAQKAFELLGDDRVGTGGDRAAAPRADARVRHARGQVARTCGRSSVASMRSI